MTIEMIEPEEVETEARVLTVDGDAFRVTPEGTSVYLSLNGDGYHAMGELDKHAARELGNALLIAADSLDN